MAITVPDLTGAVAYDDPETLIGTFAPSGGVAPYEYISISFGDFLIADGSAVGNSQTDGLPSRRRFTAAIATGTSSAAGSAGRVRAATGATVGGSAANGNPTLSRFASGSTGGDSNVTGSPARGLTADATAQGQSTAGGSTFRARHVQALATGGSSITGTASVVSALATYNADHFAQIKIEKYSIEVDFYALNINLPM